MKRFLSLIRFLTTTVIAIACGLRPGVALASRRGR